MLKVDIKYELTAHSSLILPRASPRGEPLENRSTFLRRCKLDSITIFLLKRKIHYVTLKVSHTTANDGRFDPQATIIIGQTTRGFLWELHFPTPADMSSSIFSLVKQSWVIGLHDTYPGAALLA
jgi:hypothetical protein